MKALSGKSRSGQYVKQTKNKEKQQNISYECQNTINYNIVERHVVNMSGHMKFHFSK